jgi:mycofactocin precursor
MPLDSTTTTTQPEAATPTPKPDVRQSTVDNQGEPLVLANDLVEDISIDGMCGVY